MWHLRLGHVKDTRVSKSEKDGLIAPFGDVPILIYEPYILGKMVKSPFDGHVERTIEVWELVHSDFCEPFNEMARGGYYYFITITNDYSRMHTWWSTSMNSWKSTNCLKRK